MSSATVQIVALLFGVAWMLFYVVSGFLGKPDESAFVVSNVFLAASFVAGVRGRT